MTPSTLVRNRRGPLSFIGQVALALEREARPLRAQPIRPRCCALLDDGRRCDLPGRYLDFKRGGHVCWEHKPAKRTEALSL